MLRRTRAASIAAPTVVPPKSTGVRDHLHRVAAVGTGTSTKPPAARACGSSTTSWACCTGAHHTSSRSKTAAHSASGLVANTSLSSDDELGRVARTERSASTNRGSSAHSGRSTARSTSGQWRSACRPSIQNRLPSPAVYALMSGLGGAATVIGTVGTPRRSAMLMSHPIMYMPMRSSDVDTSWPSPVRSRAKQRGGHGPGRGHARHVVAHPAALVREVGAVGRERRGHAGSRPERADVVGGAVAARRPRCRSRSRGRRRGAGCAPTRVA